MADNPKHLLLIEDEAALREVIGEQLTDRGYHVVQAGSGEAALERLAEFAFDIIVTDLRLPGIDGSAVVDAAVERYPDIVAIVVTGYGTVKDAVEAIKRGAADFVSKPFQIDELLHVLDAALEQRRLKSENAYLRAQLEERFRFEGIIGKSAPMTRLFQLLETVAATNSTILITGETGTGKEIVARAIHQSSPRRQHRFVAINCSAIPETLLEAELSATSAARSPAPSATARGRLEQAHKGTLFLDEVGTMSAALQTKLLRVLQEREFERASATRTRRRWTCGVLPRPTAISRAWWPKASSARISSTGSTSFPCCSRSCASGKRTSLCSCSTSSRSFSPPPPGPRKACVA